ncbi:glycosyltransferase family 4 protein [Halobacillus sp. MO56]
MKKRALLISQYFPPDINAASFRINDLYNALLSKKYEVTVVTSYPQKAEVETTKEIKNIHRIKLGKVDKKSFFNYLKNFFGFMFKSTFYSLFHLRREKYDYIIVTSPPLFVAVGGMIASLVKRSKLIIDIRDLWPDSAVSAGMLKSDGLLYKVTKKLEKLLYKKADIITCVSKPMRDYIYEESKNSNIHVLYNGISPETLENPPRVEERQNIEKVTIGYAGNIGIVQNMGVILKVSQLLEQYDVNSIFEFIIIGDGIERKRLEKDAKELGLQNIIFTGALSKKDVISKLNNVDVLFLSLKEDATLDKTIPSKLFDYLLNNKPIITSIKGEGRKILNDLGSTLFFEPSSPESLANAILEYTKDKRSYDKAAKNNREYVIKNYNREKGFKEFLERI